MFLTELIMEFTFMDGDSDATIGPLRFAGAGADTGDKGVYKSMTGAEKYFLMKTFLIATGDDPEADDKVDKEAAAASAADGSRIKGGKAPAGTKRGGKTDLASSAQRKELARLIKEKNMTAVTFTIAVATALEREIGTDDAKATLENLKADEAGKVIQYITEMVDVDKDVDESGEEPPLPDENEGQDTLDIV